MPLFNSTVNNRVTQSDPLADDSLFQFVDVRDFGMIDSPLKDTPHGVVNRVEVWSVIDGQRADGIKSFKCILNYCVDGSIWHFKFPKVVQAHTFGEVDILVIVLLRVFSGTILPIFIEIGSYLTEKEQKNKLAQFFLRIGVVYTMIKIMKSKMLSVLRHQHHQLHNRLIFLSDSVVTLDTVVSI